MVVGAGAGVDVVRERHYETFVFVIVPSRECILRWLWRLVAALE